MSWAVTVVIAYGILTIVGGLIGFFKARSAASLIAGSIAGLLVLASAAAMRQGNQPAAGLTVVIAVVLGRRFLRGWRDKRRVMPDLVMVIASAVAALAVIAWLLTTRSAAPVV